MFANNKACPAGTSRKSGGDEGGGEGGGGVEEVANIRETSSFPCNPLHGIYSICSRPICNSYSSSRMGCNTFDVDRKEIRKEEGKERRDFTVLQIAPF